MHHTVVQSLYRLICVAQVAAVAALVSGGPEYDARVVAVAQHHAHIAVDEHRRPRCVACKSLIVVALNVSLVHAVKPVVVEHGVHLGLARVVAGAHGVDVRLLHERYVLQHCRHINGASLLRMGVLSVHSLEEHALSVDVYKRSSPLDVAESVFCGEHHLLASVGIALAHNHGVEMRFLSVPRRETG